MSHLFLWKSSYTPCIPKFNNRLVIISTCLDNNILSLLGLINMNEFPLIICVIGNKLWWLQNKFVIAFLVVEWKLKLNNHNLLVAQKGRVGGKFWSWNFECIAHIELVLDGGTINAIFWTIRTKYTVASDRYLILPFFILWLYNPTWILAFQTILHHSPVFPISNSHCLQVFLHTRHPSFLWCCSVLFRLVSIPWSFSYFFFHPS